MKIWNIHGRCYDESKYFSLIQCWYSQVGTTGILMFLSYQSHQLECNWESCPLLLASYTGNNFIMEKKKSGQLANPSKVSSLVNHGYCFHFVAYWLKDEKLTGLKMKDFLNNLTSINLCLIYCYYSNKEIVDLSLFLICSLYYFQNSCILLIIETMTATMT